jgi:surface carbohydrate biosynthesis protein (TIGR04326 family)
MNLNESMLIWDLNSDSLKSSENIIFWSENIQNINMNIISIPHIVEINSEVYKKKYLKWVYDLGYKKIGNKTLIEYFLIDDKFSYWFISSIAQKFNISDYSNINNLIKLYALEDYFKNNKISRISLATGNLELRNTIKDLCIAYSINFSDFSHLKQENHKIYLLSIFKVLIFSVKYFFKNISNSFKKLNVYGEISFFDILVHIDEKSFVQNKFISNYWTKLIDKLDELDVNINWIHIFFSHKNISTKKQANIFIKNNNNKNNTHYLFDNIFDIISFVRAIFDFIIIYLKSLKFHKNLFILNSFDSKIKISILLENELYKSLSGTETIMNLIRFRQYKYLFKKIPKQKIGFYIQENQPWEIMLVYSWKNAGHGKIVGVPHTTIRFWDLRYFFDSRFFSKSSIEEVYMPDLIAVNGPVAKKMLLDTGYFKESLVRVEALRYLYLRDLSLNFNGSVRDYCKIIICGDFLSSTNDKILLMVEEAVNKLNVKCRLFFKPHPAYDYLLSKFHLKIEVDRRSIFEVFKGANIVITSNVSSTATDAYCMGIPVIQVLDGKYFNMSALRNFSGVEFISDSTQMANAIERLGNVSNTPIGDYFYLGENLEGWTNLIKANI